MLKNDRTTLLYVPMHVYAFSLSRLQHVSLFFAKEFTTRCRYYSHLILLSYAIRYPITDSFSRIFPSSLRFPPLLFLLHFFFSTAEYFPSPLDSIYTVKDSHFYVLN
jgi:hypothetical protein